MDLEAGHELTFGDFGSGRRRRGRHRDDGEVLGPGPSAKLIAEEAKRSRGWHGETRLGCKGARV